MPTQVSVQDRIFKPIEEVYDAIVDPEKMSGYFISGASKKIEKPEKQRKVCGVHIIHLLFKIETHTPFEGCEF